MKTLILSFFIHTMVVGLSNAQVVEIPDTNFLIALIDNGVDVNTDGSISYEEAEGIYGGLYIGSKRISDLTGIEAFVNIDTLDCSNNYLTILNVSNQRISFLDVSYNSALTTLDCQNNRLHDLKLDGCKALTELNCSYNPLISLDIHICINLEILNIDSMPDLYSVWVWEKPFPPSGIEVSRQGSENVIYTTVYPGNAMMIPDIMFRYALFNQGVDANADSLISWEEAQEVTSLFIGSAGISDIQGIRAFKPGYFGLFR